MGAIERIRGDLVTLRGVLRALKMTKPIAKHPTRVFPNVIEELAEKYADASALLSSRERLTYRGLFDRSNRYARWALAQRLGKGETVCLLMPNRPEYMAIWLGVTRAGGVVALLNTNLTGNSLAHCINIVEPKHIIVAAELLEPLKSARPHLTVDIKVWAHGADGGEFSRVDEAAESYPGHRLFDSERPQLTIEDRALYIYTSGTTGLPKPANINHYRLMLATHGFAGVMNTRPSDRMYNALPMYHTNGGVVATGATLVRGGTVVIREKFSAREFWDDVVAWDCTMFFYIGELCRYLANSPPNQNETKHRIRLCCGNGLRPDVWPRFVQRFRVPQILEFYAATEGNVSMFNFEGKPGAVGRIPWFLAHRFPVKIVDFDVVKQEPVRDPAGLCIECATNEAGEAIGRILNDPSKPASRFEGYASRAETERKILRNVFESGDAWFRTGDLLRKDQQGYFYFVDRIGDTFRWKGENVSTAEVAEAISGFPAIDEANVYGVSIPGQDGKAGMAALVVNSKLDLTRFRQQLATQLPEYAWPVFLRIRDEMEVTGTFKQKKVDLVREGFDPARTTDAIYFNDPQAHAFVRLDGALYERIVGGAIRL
jgi:fatty-acyl-CoA synthase